MKTGHYHHRGPVVAFRFVSADAEGRCDFGSPAAIQTFLQAGADPVVLVLDKESEDLRKQLSIRARLP
jgi:hypothetical protein